MADTQRLGRWKRKITLIDADLAKASLDAWSAEKGARDAFKLRQDELRQFDYDALVLAYEKEEDFGV